MESGGVATTASTTGQSGATTAASGQDATGPDGSSEDDGGPKLDVAAGDVGVDGCVSACVAGGNSYVWIANSPENTISKIDTRAMVEVGRYFTRPDQEGNPSRTSVSVDGRAVVVANRSGGITKIWANPSDCVDQNGNGMVDTSTGPSDVLAPDQEECIAWHTPFPDATTQRPVAWTSGVYNEETCEFENQKVWTAASYGTGFDTCTGADGIWFYRLNGDTGEVEETIHASNLGCGQLGAYGAAVDHAGNAWFTVFGTGQIVRVDFETLEVTSRSGARYGITVDTQGRPWTDQFSRLDLDTGTWDSNDELPIGSGGGLVEDQSGRMWKGAMGQVGWVDVETMQVGDLIDLPTASMVRGIGVDIDGFIWAVPLNSDTVYKIDPETYEYESISGFVSPYTYSDMGGGQITNVTCNPPG